MRTRALMRSTGVTTLIVLTAVILGSFTTYRFVAGHRFRYFEEGFPIQRQNAVLEGHAMNPWQYRVFAPYAIKLGFKVLGHFHVPHYVAVTFISLRLIQDILIMLLCYAYYRRAGILVSHAWVGMALLAWGMSYSQYESDLSFNTFFDVIFYLLAGLCILKRRFVWIVPLTVAAALNRETSGFIPLLPLLVSIFVRPRESWRKTLPVVIPACVLFVLIFVGLRLSFGEQALFLPYGIPLGLPLLKHNLFRLDTWVQLVATLSIVPIIAIVGYRNWIPEIRVFFWTIVPIWMVVHAFGAVMAESRLFLVPQALVFIPGALLGVQTRGEWSDREPRRS